MEEAQIKLAYVDDNHVVVSKIAMRIHPYAGTAIAAKFVLSPLIIEVVAFDGILASQVHKVFPRRIDKHVTVSRANTTVARLDFMLVE